MLTLLAVVHWNRKKLPEQRAELYEAAIDYLLEARREQSAFPLALRREALQALALAMVEDAAGVQRSLGLVVAGGAVASVLGVKPTQAEAFVDDEALHSGLLVSRTEGEVEFWHLSFEEFLAASQLAALQLVGEDYWPHIETHLDDDRWSEVLLLLASCLHRRGGARGSKRLVEKILGTGKGVVGRARAVGLVGRLLRDLKPYGGEPAAGTGYEQALGDTLALFAVGGSAAPEVVRVEVGEALGAAGDPRLLDGTALRVALPGGRFLMGAQAKDKKTPGYDAEAYDDEAPPRWVTVSPFTLGRYPVTVGEFRRFVEAKDRGFGNPRLWAPEGWAWRENQNIVAPGSWDAQVRHPNRPVVEVSWYEADAYCRWLGGRLPTEAEWELAARGTEGRKYPWGGEGPGEEHANFNMRAGKPSPVGIYPRGASPEGVFDLAGNVLEWCADWFGDYPAAEQENPPGPAQGSSRVLRGGSFLLVSRVLRGAYRNGVPPDLRDYYIGFRVVWSVSAGLVRA